MDNIKDALTYLRITLTYSQAAEGPGSIIAIFLLLSQETLTRQSKYVNLIRVT